jgi:hypothetical protein
MQLMEDGLAGVEHIHAALPMTVEEINASEDIVNVLPNRQIKTLKSM